MAEFGNLSLPQNPLLSYAQIRAQGAQADNFEAAAAGQQIENQAARQTLIDRETLRGLAGGLSTRDPSAMATATTLGQPGTGAVTALGTLDHNAAADKLALAQFDRSRISFPGLPGGGAAAVPGAPAGSGGGSGSFEDRLGGSESVDPAAVNSQGFAGRFQFGTGRLADLGLYQPAQGEDLKTNHWEGRLNIPGFENVRTLADFRNNLDAQRAAFGLHIQDIDRAIASTPGADKLSRDGLRAVAHLGGVDGMRRFVETGGAYNPADRNGTSLSGYYSKFSSGGPQAFQSAFGHPAGRLGTPPQGGQDGQPAQSGAPVVLNPQYASRTGAAGMPQTATDAAPAAPADGQPLPVPPIPPAGGPPPLPSSPAPEDGDVLNIDAAASAQSLPRGTRYSVAGGPVQVRAPGAWSPTSDLPGAAASALPNGVAPNDLFGVGASAPAPQQQQQNALSRFGQMPSPAGPPAPGAAPGVAPAAAPAAGGRVNPLYPVGAAAALPPASAPSAQGTPGMGRPSEVAQSVAADAAGARPAAMQPQPGAGAVAPQQMVQAAPQPALPPGTVFARDGQGQFVNHGHQPGYALAAVPDGRGGYTQMSLPMPGTGRDLEFKQAGTTMIAYDKRTGLPVSQTTVPDARRPSTINTGDAIIQRDASGNTISSTPLSTRPIQAQTYKEDREQAQQQIDVGMQAQQQQVRLLEARQVLQGLPTGADGEARAKWAGWAETYMSPAFASAFKAKLNLPDAVPAQEFAKLMTQNAGQQERSVAGARGGLGMMQIFMGANPGLNMQPNANRDLLNALLVMSQADQDYAAGHIAFVNRNGTAFTRNEGQYVPASNFAQQWVAQRNPQVYAAAAGAMNGKDFDHWSKNLKPDEIARVGGIIGRIDPSVTVMGPSGKAFRVPAPQGGAQ